MADEQYIENTTMFIFGRENEKKLPEFQYVENLDFDYRIYYDNNDQESPDLSFMVFEGAFSCEDECKDNNVLVPIYLMMHGWCVFDGFRHVWVNEGYFHYASPDMMIAIWSDLKKLAIQSGVNGEEYL
jgi:hypothetical protein